MKRHLWTTLLVPTLLLAVLSFGANTQPQCVPVEPEIDCSQPEICGDGIDNDCDGLVDEGCVPPACYGDADCPDAHVCVITDDCCPPPGCEPGMDCPAVCAACGECRLRPSDCADDAECPPGHVCVQETWCPPCSYEDPPCPQPCYRSGQCEGTPTPCASLCDCYAAGIPFTQQCRAMCPTCDMFWACESGACVEACGPVPPEVRDCRM